MVFILYPTPITTGCKHISEKMDPEFDCNSPLAPNRTPHRMLIRTQILTCRQPLFYFFNFAVMLIRLKKPKLRHSCSCYQNPHRLYWQISCLYKVVPRTVPVPTSSLSVPLVEQPPSDSGGRHVQDGIPLLSKLFLWISKVLRHLVQVAN
jgi:hypothetical protein